MIMLFSLFLFFSLAVNATSIEYQSLGGADITIEKNNHNFFLGDALGKVKRCDDSLVYCADFKGFKIVTPKSFNKPLSHELFDGTVVTYLPIKRSITILGEKLSGYTLSLKYKGEEFETTIFFNDQGVIYFSAFGSFYIAKDDEGYILN